MTHTENTLRVLVDYAYEMGFHEVGYDVVSEALHIAHNDGLAEAADFCVRLADDYEPRNNEDYAASTIDWVASSIRNLIQPPPPRGPSWGNATDAPKEPPK